MKLNELVLLHKIMEKELSTAKERTIYFKKVLSGIENQMDDEVDEEVIENLGNEAKSIRRELMDAAAYENTVANIVNEISEREFSII